MMHGWARLTLIGCAGISVSTSLLAQTDAGVTTLIGGPEARSAVLERPRKILVLSDRIIVVERGEPFLQVFDLDGRLRQRAGRRGAGPGEFRLVAAVAVSADGVGISAIDTPLGRLTRFVLRDTLEFRGSQALALQAEDACFLGTRLFANTRTPEGIVHELSGTGAELRAARALGEAHAPHPLAGSPLYQNYLADGHLLCDTIENTVTLASALTGYVQVLPVDGGAQRTIVIEGFRALEFSAAGRSLTLSKPAGGFYDEVIDVRRRDGGVVLTVGRTDSEHSGAGDYASYREIELTSRGPQRVGLTTRWRFVGTAGGRAVCYKTDPEPVIGRASGPACP